MYVTFGTKSTLLGFVFMFSDLPKRMRNLAYIDCISKLINCGITHGSIRCGSEGVESEADPTHFANIVVVTGEVVDIVGLNHDAQRNGGQKILDIQDENGIINFGVKGGLDQEKTPFNIEKLLLSVQATISHKLIFTWVLLSNFPTLFDCGTSFTYLINHACTRLTESFHSRIQDKQHASDPRIPFEYFMI
ncbi:hypothetical protein POM88_050716 [Heracleum sosnowskyi]|uniref:Uncharacterized protein n=1 Tax=Heracleum sosnowskyi TaxID=360622 RepID=A0AAD8H0P2_9APIA|nr:hypothetical protein POM88_050716 [Heracleum sosnowskyi]